MCFLVICKYSLEKSLFSSYTFFDGGVCISILSSLSCLNILEINPLSFASFPSIVPHFMGFFFCLIYDYMCCAEAKFS